MKKAVFHTDFLFPDTGFWTGAGSVFNVSGNYFDFAVSKNESDADRKALSSDWGMVGQDIICSLKEDGSETIADSNLTICEK
jgi:hypothetical protein